MSQHDMDLANAAGAAFRSDLNLALVAQSSNQSGASAPATTRPYMFWADTTNGLLKQRNAADNAWLVRGNLAETFVIDRSSNTILAGADWGRTFRATAGFTQTLTAAATLADGWYVDYRVESGATLVIDPNSSENIDGATTKSITGPASGRIYCNGTAFYTIGFPGSSSGGLVSILNFTAQTVALTSISNASPGVLTVASAPQLPENGSPMRLTTSGGLPTGLSTGTTYWVVGASGSTFNLAATKGGAAINTSSAGSGTHTMNSVYDKTVNNPSTIVVEVFGGGGGGGGSSSGTNAGGGGGSGGYSLKKIANAALGSTETITIGAGGTAGTSAPGAGGTGGTSSFGSHASATGGVGGAAGSGSPANVAGGTGGAGASGDVNLTGAPGSAGIAAGSNPLEVSGTGGASKLGGAGLAIVGAGGAGNAAVVNSGSGGSGAGVLANSTGGLGGSGRVIIYEYS